MLSLLLVDDQDDGRQILAEYLAVAGFRVTTAENGLRAIEMANQCRPDLVLMDLAMPVLDGWEATRRLKEASSTRDIPVWALSAFSDPLSRERALQAGCSKILVKPVNPAQLVQWLHALAREAPLYPGMP